MRDKLTSCNITQHHQFTPVQEETANWGLRPGPGLQRDLLHTSRNLSQIQAEPGQLWSTERTDQFQQESLQACHVISWLLILKEDHPVTQETKNVTRRFQFTRIQDSLRHFKQEETAADSGLKQTGSEDPDQSGSISRFWSGSNKHLRAEGSYLEAPSLREIQHFITVVAPFV